jgi:hypothetical protein
VGELMKCNSPVPLLFLGNLLYPGSFWLVLFVFRLTLTTQQTQSVTIILAIDETALIKSLKLRNHSYIEVPG